MTSKRKRYDDEFWYDANDLGMRDMKVWKMKMEGNSKSCN